MPEELFQAAEEYRKRHPEVDEIMRRFRMSQEVYEKALKAISIPVRRGGPTYRLTTEGRYNVNVSTANR